MLIAKYKGEYYRYNHFPEQDNPYEIYVENKALPDLENRIEECNYMTGAVEGYSFPIDISDERIEEVFDNSITFRLDSDKEFEKNYEGYLEVGVHYIPESKEVNLYTTGLIPGWTVIGKYESATSFPVDKLIDVKIEARYYKKDGIVYKDKPLVEITPIDNKDIEEYLDKYDFDQF